MTEEEREDTMPTPNILQGTIFGDWEQPRQEEPASEPGDAEPEVIQTVQFQDAAAVEEKTGQLGFVDSDEHWQEEWQGMPEFSQEDLTPFKSLTVHFATYEDLKQFAATIGQRLTMETKWTWYPEASVVVAKNKRWIDAHAEAAQKEST